MKTMNAMTTMTSTKKPRAAAAKQTVRAGARAASRAASASSRSKPRPKRAAAPLSESETDLMMKQTELLPPEPLTVVLEPRLAEQVRQVALAGTPDETVQTILDDFFSVGAPTMTGLVDRLKGLMAEARALVPGKNRQEKLLTLLGDYREHDTHELVLVAGHRFAITLHELKRLGHEVFHDPRNSTYRLLTVLEVEKLRREERNAMKSVRSQLSRAAVGSDVDPGSDTQAKARGRKQRPR